MKLRGLFFLCLVLLSGLPLAVRAAPEDAGLPNYITADFANPAQFVPVPAASSLPAPILKATGSLAEPGKPYQETTVYANPPLPDGRLIWAVQKQKEYIIYYEAGGYADGYKLLIAQLDDNPRTASVLWRGGTVSHGKLRDFPAFLQAWKNGSLVRQWP